MGLFGDIGHALGSAGKAVGSGISSVVHTGEQAVSSGVNGAVHLAGDVAHAAAPVVGAVEHAGAAAMGLGGQNLGSNPVLRPWVDRLWGGDGKPKNNGTNQIGPAQGGGFIDEGSPFSNALRHIPYLGDYLQAASVTHDQEHIHPKILNGITAMTNVVGGGIGMGALDAIPRLFGHSLFLADGNNGR